MLARGLAGLIEPPPGAVIIRSDVVRKHLFGAAETTALPESAYRPDVTERVYGMLSRTAQRVLAAGLFGRARCRLSAGSGTDGNRSLADSVRRALRRPVPHGGSRDAAWRGSSGARTMRLMQQRNVALTAGDFRDRRGRLAYDRCLGDAGPVAAQRLCFVVRGAGMSADDEGPSNPNVQPAQGRCGSRSRLRNRIPEHGARLRRGDQGPSQRARAPAMPRPCIRSGSRSRGCAPPWRSLRRSWSMRNGCV